MLEETCVRCVGVLYCVYNHFNVVIGFFGSYSSSFTDSDQICYANTLIILG
jgi:hypothetical protein